MDHVVANLVVAPFRDIIDKGRTAVGNAARSRTMLKAARDLVKEGERALNRLEPICWRYYEAYGSDFIDALRKNDEIRKHRRDLNKIVYEFDDYVAADAFDADQYARLQALTRDVVPKIYDALIEMGLEAPPKDHAQLSPPSSPLSRPGSPFQHSPSHASLTFPHPFRAPPPVISAPESPRDMSTVDATEQLKRLIQSRLFDEAPGARRGASALTLEPPSERSPRLPSANPWEPPGAGDGHTTDLSPVDEAPMRAESPIDPYIPQVSPDPRWQVSSLARRPAARCGRGPDCDAAQRRRLASNLASEYIPAQPHSRQSTPVPEDDSADIAMPLPLLPQAHSSPASNSPKRLHFGRPRRPSGESAASSGDDSDRSANFSLRIGAGFESLSKIDSLGGPPTSPPPPIPQSQGQPELPIKPPFEIDSGLILVEPEVSDKKSQSYASLRGPMLNASDSFYQHKGFCPGAQEVIRGEIGVKKVQKPVHRTLSKVVARCSGCLYELNLNDVEEDVSMQGEGNLAQCGVKYRIRFLQKSHLPAKRVDDIPYGCVFCVHQGHTLDKSDATVFFTKKALFSHLARHPRPLPKVSGVTVVEEAEVPEHLRNNYDIHLPNPPVAHPAHENQDDIIDRPTGVAKKEARRIYGQRLPYDRSAPLELDKGARITGIKWPPKHSGEWMIAWHDGVCASVPTDLIKLDPPPAAEIKMDGTSHVCAKARWKSALKEKDAGNWLKFNKNDTITNISWPYPEHWCWSGKNTKGKWGIFPRAFIDISTVQELSPDLLDRMSSTSTEKSKTSSVLSKLSVRKSGRPSSLAESTSSRETARPGLRLPSRSRRGTVDAPGAGERSI
ncbi:variant SH3 domain-containing protein [Hirsutella rhossiliensis]|uniref:Variant SH3 domain-containing protein n=1 Tax=Hirsutella rhossiliensis TaxID=111463 RepID=A0A9P8N2U8_9HYPO|nr:variant SH3 domain-containing protein [Hirsutella rhossiliensis]KAH0965830.1 variant SH3 domain-containing protein [Hirsutella rhossiliensis]